MGEVDVAGVAHAYEEQGYHADVVEGGDGERAEQSAAQPRGERGGID